MISNERKNKKFKKDIDLIISTIHTIVKDELISIILYGSYGRDEGAFYIKNNKVYVYNDYDLLLVVNKPLENSKIENIKINLTKYLNIKWIDISQILYTKLKKLKPSIFNYDLKYGSNVIWGDSSVFEIIPEFKSEQITFEDAEILFYSRSFTFLGSVNSKNFVCGIQGECSRFFRNQMAKAILAIDDVLLIHQKSYHSSYVERVKRIEQLYPAYKQIIKLSNWALNEKLNPTDEKMTGDETYNLFFSILKIYLDVMFNALSILYRQKITNTDDLIKAKMFSLRENLEKIKVLILRRSLKDYNRLRKVWVLQSYTLESFQTNNNEKIDIYNKCLKILNKLYPEQKFEITNWENLRCYLEKIIR